MADVFERVRLKPTQLRTVADRRYADAQYLCASQQNRHANAVLYLGGFVVECLLKARLMQRFAWLQAPHTKRVPSARERRLYDLCYRWHDLAAILEHLPEVLEQLTRTDPTGRTGVALRTVCERWTVFARYSPRTATMEEAEQFLDQIKEIRACLR
jgi:hypothetical protein